MDADFVNDGYIRVYQDVRGMDRSEGEYVMTRPLRVRAGLTPPGDSRVHQSRIRGTQDVGSDPKPLGHARTRALDEHRRIAVVFGTRGSSGCPVFLSWTARIEGPAQAR